MTETILDLVAVHPTVKNIIVHIETNDVMKQPEVQAQDLIDLLNPLIFLKC